MATESFSSTDDWRRVLARAVTGRPQGVILVFVAGHDDRSSPLAEAQEVIEYIPRTWQRVLVFSQESLFDREWKPNLGPNVSVLFWKLKDEGAQLRTSSPVTSSLTNTHTCASGSVQKKSPGERTRCSGS